MDISAVIDGILERKEAEGLTMQQVADRSNVPKSTVTRILRKETPNPSMKNLADIAAAVGYVLDPVTPSTMKDSTKDAYITYLQEAILAEKESCRQQIAEQKSMRNQFLAERNRTILVLAIALLAESVSMMVMLIMLFIQHG